MEQLSFKLPVFEGPLDALLYLISKNRLDICEVSISNLLDQYMEYLSQMREQDLEVTSAFLEMASRLVQIKSAMLLPKNEDEASEKDDLIAELMEYQTCKAMAQALRDRGEGFNRFVREPQPFEPDKSYKSSHQAQALYDAYAMLAKRAKRRRPPTVESFTGIVGRRIVSVASRVIHIIKRLIKEGKRNFGSMFDDAQGRSEAVATFLALLELVKSGNIVIEDDEGCTIRMNKR